MKFAIHTRPAPPAAGFCVGLARVDAAGALSGALHPALMSYKEAVRRELVHASGDGIGLPRLFWPGDGRTYLVTPQAD